MRVVFISDLHIPSPEAPLYRSLVALTDRLSGTDATLVLGGDIFDAWMGDKPFFKELYQELLQALKRATGRGVSVYYIEGNHDFHFQKTVRGTGAQPITRDFTLVDGEKKIYFAHGDLADCHNWSYRALRLFFRSWIFRLIIAVLPGRQLWHFLNFLSGQSRDRKPLLMSELPIERRERMRRTYRNFAAEKIAEGFDMVVLGHCHDLDETHFQVDGRRGQYINIGYPPAHGSYLVYSTEDGKFQRTAIK